MLRLVLALVLAAGPAAGRTLAELEAAGFTVARVLPLLDDFRGCDRLHAIRLLGGADFLCQTASFTYVRHALALVLRNAITGETVLLINGTEYAGRLEDAPGFSRHVETGTGPLVGEVTAPVHLAPNEAGVQTRPVSGIAALGEMALPGHDTGEPHQ